MEALKDYDKLPLQSDVLSTIDEVCNLKMLGIAWNHYQNQASKLMYAI